MDDGVAAKVHGVDAEGPGLRHQFPQRVEGHFRLPGHKDSGQGETYNRYECSSTQKIHICFVSPPGPGGAHQKRAERKRNWPGGLGKKGWDLTYDGPAVR